jgi:hypothetical protein
MSSFKEFMDDTKELPNLDITSSNASLSAIQDSLKSTVLGILAPLSLSNDQKQEFSEKTSNLLQDEAFISEFSNRLGQPLELETEDEFVERGSGLLRSILYDKFEIW